MKTHRIVILSLPVLLASSTALAQQQGATGGDATATGGDKMGTSAPCAAKKKTTTQTTKKKTTTTKSTAAAPGTSDTSKAGTTTTTSGDMTTPSAPEATPSTSSSDNANKAGAAGAAGGEAVGTTSTTAAMQKVDVGTSEKNVLGRNDVKDKFSAEPLFGYGTNDFNAGIGGRVGYTFDVPVYVGGTFMWYWGDTQQSITNNAIIETKRNFYYPGVEVGYDFGFGRNFMVRPYGGAGILLFRERNTVNDVSASNTDSSFMIYPGVTARYNVSNLPVYVGADTRLLIPFENKGASYQIFAVAGVSM